jgi:CTP:phosphocholine cytidylyltransferase-like protein
MSDWDDVIIGKGDKGCSSTLCFDIKGEHSISHNGISFWISDCIMGTGCTIFKDTKEGQKLIQMIKEKVDLKNIKNYIDSLILKNISVSTLKIKIKDTQDEYFRKGEESKQDEIKSVLGVRNIGANNGLYIR